MSTKNLRNWSDPEIAEEAMKVLRTEMRQAGEEPESGITIVPPRQGKDRGIPVGRWTLHHRALTGRNHYREPPSPRPPRTRNEPSRTGGGHRRERGREDDLEHRAPPAAPPPLLQRGLHRRGASATQTIRSSRPRRGRSSTRPSRHGFGATRPFGFESTWSGSSRPAIVRRAHGEGYETHAVFLGTRHPDINVQRVRRRVLEGGHDIAENEIRRRWHAAGENLVRNWQFFDHIEMLDNSGRAPQVVFARDHDADVVLRELPRWAKRLTRQALE